MNPKTIRFIKAFSFLSTIICLPGFDYFMGGFKPNQPLGQMLCIPFILSCTLFFASWNQEDIRSLLRRFLRALAWELTIIGGFAFAAVMWFHWSNSRDWAFFYTLKGSLYWMPFFIGLSLLFAVKNDRDRI